MIKKGGSLRSPALAQSLSWVCLFLTVSIGVTSFSIFLYPKWKQNSYLDVLLLLDTEFLEDVNQGDLLPQNETQNKILQFYVYF